MRTKKFKRLNTGRDGITTLIAVLAIGAFALGSALTISLGALSGLSKNINIVSGDQKFFTAESFMSEGIYQYVKEIEATGVSTYTPLPPDLMNGVESGAITVTPLSWPYVIIRGDAENGNGRRIVKEVVSVFPEGQAFKYAVYAENLLNFGGSVAVNGNVFANNGIGFTGNNAEVNGDAFTPGTIPAGGTDNVLGEIFTGVDVIAPPVINTTPYKDAAIAAGTYFTDDDAAESYLGNQIRDAVIFVDDPYADKTKIAGSNTALNGSIVVLGNLELSGGVYSATGNYAAVVVYGDLRITGGTTINGVVYVAGETSFGSGNNVINGSLVSAQGASQTDVTGNSTINYDPALATTWPDLAGLDTTTVEAPIVIDWGEE